ncbi:MAG: DPP IV N-terminal domain-containing protein, partial [Actinocrinis sp.]
MAPTDELPGQLPRTALFTCGVPYQFTIAGRGDTVLFLRGRTGDDRAACLWALDVATGAERLLAQAANLLGGGDQPLGAGSSATGISSYAASADGALAAFAVSGRLWVAHVGDGRVEQLPAASPVSDPRPDPTGRHIAYVCDGALRVIGVGGGSDRLIAAPDGPEVTFGVADFAGESALDGADGFWWSPDGERLLVKRVDTSRVELWHVADPADPARAPRGRRYPAAGTANAEVSLWIADLGGALTEVDSDRDAFEYVLRGGWSAQGPYVAVKSRDQRTARLLRVDPRTGATSTLGELTDTRWVQPIPGLPAVTDSGSVLWHVDDGETRRLTVDAVPVTPPGLQLRALLGIEGDTVFLAATREPTERHLHTYRPGEGVRQLTTEPGVHAGERRAGTFVHVARGPEFFGSRTVVRRSGAPAVPVASFGATPALDLHVTRLVLGPRRLRAALYLPSWYQPRDGVDGRGGGRLPVLMDPYGGAGVQRVTADQGPHHLISQWFAEHGFAVLVVDSSG